MSNLRVNKKGIYLVEQIKNHELNLEHVDEEMRMEQVRQASSKLDWASFGQAVRRNLLEKRNTLDAEARKDVLRGIAYMRSKMPIDPTSPAKEKFRIMAESLGCSHNTTPRGWSLFKEELTMEFSMNDDKVAAVMIRFWDDPPFFSQDSIQMLQDGKWTEFRNKIAQILATYDKDIVGDDRFLCKGAMRMLESLFAQFSTDNHFTAINRNNYGYWLPNHDLRQGRIYYLVEPFYRSVLAKKQRKFHFDKSDYDSLPYFEFTFVKHGSPCQLPIYNLQGLWDESIEADVAVCLKLSNGFLMSEQTRKKLGAISAKTATIRHYTNIYRFQMGEMSIDEDRIMMTQFHTGAQHYYKIDVNSFKNDGDTVITEIFLKNLQDFHQVIALLRNERMHISLWESIMADCYELQGIEEHYLPAIPMDVFLSRKEFVFSFETLYAPIKIYIREAGALEFKVQVVHGVTGQQIAERIDETLSRKLNETWSIPVTLSYAVSGEDCKLEQIKVPLRKENPETRPCTPPPRFTRQKVTIKKQSFND